MNDTTFQGDGKIAFVPVVVNAKQHKQTNADKIRAMSDEELAQFLWSIGQSPFNGWTYISGKPMFEGNGWAAWLKATVEEKE